MNTLYEAYGVEVEAVDFSDFKAFRLAFYPCPVCAGVHPLGTPCPWDWL